MIDGALDHPLETGGGFRFFLFLDGQGGQVFFQVIVQLFPQLVDFHVAGAQHRARVIVVAQRQQQMLQGGKLVPPFNGAA